MKFITKTIFFNFKYEFYKISFEKRRKRIWWYYKKFLKWREEYIFHYFSIFFFKWFCECIQTIQNTHDDNIRGFIELKEFWWFPGWNFFFLFQILLILFLDCLLLIPLNLFFQCRLSQNQNKFY